MPGAITATTGVIITSCPSFRQRRQAASAALGCRMRNLHRFAGFRYGLCALQPPPQRGCAAVRSRLINHAVTLEDFGKYLRVGRLLHFERIEAGAHQEMKLVAQHVAGGAQCAAKAEMLAQKTRLAVGPAVAKLRKIKRDESEMAEPRFKLGNAPIIRPQHAERAVAADKLAGVGKKT